MPQMSAGGPGPGKTPAAGTVTPDPARDDRAACPRCADTGQELACQADLGGQRQRGETR